MKIKKNRTVWKHSWSYHEGTIVTVTILLLGFTVQALSRDAVLRIAPFPWNLAGGLVFLTLLVALFIFFKMHPIIKGLGSVKFALPAILGFTFLVLLMGFVKQDVPSDHVINRLFGLNHLVKTWPFMLLNFYLMVLLGIVTLKRLTPISIKNFGFFLNHFGLFLVLFSTALGSSDMQRLTLNCYEGQPESKAVDRWGKAVELPITIELLDFKIDEFRPKIMIVDNSTGQIVIEKGKSQYGLLDRNSFDLFEFHIELVQFIETAAKIDDVYSPDNEPGAAQAAKLVISGLKDSTKITGWVCSGSYILRSETLKINDKYSLVMLPAEPTKFSSSISIQTKSGKHLNPTIEVNQPFNIDGWTIYQLSYDTNKGRWSDLSVLELVRDPWLPAVYFGIFLMMAGAGFLFVTGYPKIGGIEHVA